MHGPREVGAASLGRALPTPPDRRERRPMADIRASLAEFGRRIHRHLRLLDDECPELLPYATLLTARRNRNAALGVVDAVLRMAGRAAGVPGRRGFGGGQ